MASLGVEAIERFARTGEKPAASPDRDFLDTGAVLVTDRPVEGVESIDSATALGRCWG
jgi:fructose transport system substrate-binding protein